MYVVPSIILFLCGGFTWVRPAMKKHLLNASRLGTDFQMIRQKPRRTIQRGFPYALKGIKSNSDGGWPSRSIGLYLPPFPWRGVLRCDA